MPPPVSRIFLIPEQSADQRLASSARHGFRGQLDDLKPVILQRAHDPDESGKVDGLGDERIDTQVVAVHYVLFGFRARQHHHRDGPQAGIGPHLAKHLVAVLAGHLQIQDNYSTSCVFLLLINENLYNLSRNSKFYLLPLDLAYFQQLQKDHLSA